MGDIKRFNIYYDQMADCYCEMGESPTGTYMLAEHGQKLIDALEKIKEIAVSSDHPFNKQFDVGLIAGQALKEISND